VTPPTFTLPREKPRAAARASALLLVLWALLLLSAAVLSFARWMQHDIVLHGEANRDLEARAMAHSGIALALNGKVTKSFPGLEQDFGDGLGFRVKIVSEGSKLNIAALTERDDPDKLNFLKGWLRQRGLNDEQCEVLVDCLRDWVDEDREHHLNGVEDEGEYHTPPRGGRLKSVEEIVQVRGSEPLTHLPGWQDSLTVWGGGLLDIGSAPADLLRLVPGLSEANLQRILMVRRGRDGIEGTIDDQEFKTRDSVQKFLGMNNEQYNKGVGRFIGGRDTVEHITSEGRSGDGYRQVEVVAVKPPAGKANILFWKE
jgi:hypothetical protein